MMRPVVSSILMFIFLSGLLNSTLLLLNYSLNKDGIIAMFCVNKDKPALKCNGKCHLGKQLKEATQASSNKDKTIDYRSLSEFVLEVVEETSFFNDQLIEHRKFIISTYPSEGYWFVDIPPPRFS